MKSAQHMVIIFGEEIVVGIFYKFSDDTNEPGYTNLYYVPHNTFLGKPVKYRYPIKKQDIITETNSTSIPGSTVQTTIINMGESIIDKYVGSLHKRIEELTSELGHQKIKSSSAMQQAKSARSGIASAIKDLRQVDKLRRSDSFDSINSFNNNNRKSNYQNPNEMDFDEM